MDGQFTFGLKKISYASVIYIELFSIYGFSFYKYFILMRGCGFFFINKRTFSLFTLNKLYWINFFFLTNFVFDTKLRLYKHGRKLKYLSFPNYKRSRVYANLPVRGQRTQTNSNTCKRIKH